MTSARTRDRLVQRLREQGITNLAVLDRIRNVPRHIFVDEALASRAYEDTALPIGFRPDHLAALHRGAHDRGAARGRRRSSKVLEVGTGCGYQTAVLAPLVGKHLHHRAHRAACTSARRQRLKELASATCASSTATASIGWKSQAPFDGILVAAAPLAVPEALLEQLANGGRLIVPVGPEGKQQLLRITRREQSDSNGRSLGAVAFVPLLGGGDRLSHAKVTQVRNTA